MSFSFNAPLTTFQGKGSFFYITIDKETSNLIKSQTSAFKRGWGSLRVVVTIDQQTWKTSIFPDKKQGTFLLFIKADVRKKAGLTLGSMAIGRLEIEALVEAEESDDHITKDILAIDEQSFKAIETALSRL